MEENMGRKKLSDSLNEAFMEKEERKNSAEE